MLAKRDKLSNKLFAIKYEAESCQYCEHVNSDFQVWIQFWTPLGRNICSDLVHIKHTSLLFLTSLSESTWMRRMELLGMALFLWFSAARIRGRWPRGGTWSASWLCVLNRHTAAVVTVSSASPWWRPEMLVRCETANVRKQIEWHMF